jgi:beta-lactam-binding protein with PASTA domain
MTSQIIFTLLLLLFFIFSNYISLIYGIRLGKAMQKDIPKVPVEPVVQAAKKAKKAVKLIKDWPKKSYLQKKEPKQYTDENPLWN